MNQSEGYNEIVDMLNFPHKRMLDGYREDAFDKIYDSERKYIEERIWNSFGGMHGDWMLAVYMPKLKLYDGLSKLKENLKKYTVPSDASVFVAKILFDTTKDEEYVKLLIENAEKAGDDSLRATALNALAQCKESEVGFQYLQETYVNDNSGRCRAVALKGLFYHFGAILNYNDVEEYQTLLEIRRKYTSDLKVHRVELLNQLLTELGELKRNKN